MRTETERTHPATGRIIAQRETYPVQEDPIAQREKYRAQREYHGVVPKEIAIVSIIEVCHTRKRSIRKRDINGTEKEKERHSPGIQAIQSGSNAPVAAEF